MPTRFATDPDKGQAYQRQKQTVQTQDGFGNALTTNQYDYGNLTTPARSYSSTFLYQNTTNGSAYQSLYIYDRLLTSTLTSVTPHVTLANNVYDQCATGILAVSGAPTEWDAVNYGTATVLRGNITQANAPGKTTNTCYDATGNVLSQNDNNGHSVNASISSATNFTLPDTLSPNGSSSLETSATYTGTGFFTASVAGPGQTTYDPTNSPNGTAAYTNYDAYGRVAYTLAPSQVPGQASGAKTTYTYGYSADAWTTTATTTNSNNSTHYTTTILDGFGRTTSVITGMNGTPTSEVDTVYAPRAGSPLGNMQKRTQPYAPPNSSPPNTTYTCDSVGRTISVLLPDGSSKTTYVYQGNFTTVTDPAGNWKQYASDSFGNLVMVLEPDPTQNLVVGPPTPSTYPVTNPPSGTLLTTYAYDQYNHLTQVTMPRNTANGMKTQTRTFVYSPTTYSTLNLPALWLTSATNPESGTTSYTYNPDGTLASKIDANGNTETYMYDAYQRLTGIPDRQQLFTYDQCPANAFSCTNMPGRLVEAVFASGVGSNQLSFQYGYGYTPAGKISSKSLTVQSANHVGAQWPAYGTLTATYVYDSEGALTSLQYPVNQNYTQNSTSQTFTYTLDALERPTGMTDNLNNTWASGATYNASNQALYDGTATLTYNTLLQMTGIVAAGLNMTYNYSPTHNNGQITSSVDAISGETITYTYDALKRLVAAQGKNWTEGYTYDGFGNLIQMSPTGGAPSLSLTVALDANSVPTNRINATGVSYDNNGNQNAGFGGQTFAYDAANRLATVGGSASAAFAYDANNLRLYTRNSSGTETIYFYGIDGKKLAAYNYTIITYNGNPAVQLTQINANVYFIGKLISAENNQVQVDRLGSVRSGGPGGLGHQAQYPYGVEYVTTANNREKFSTYTRDNVTGLDYSLNRYYASQWGRFLSPDPSGTKAVNSWIPLTWNRYIYTQDDPVNETDPTGLCSGTADGNYSDGDGDDGEKLIFPGPCSSGTIGDGSYTVNAVNMVTDAQGMTYIDGQLVGETGIQDDFLADMAIAYGFASLLDFIESGSAEALEAGLLEKAIGSVWKLPLSIRGLMISAIMQANLPQKFPGIDSFLDGVATSVKSIDLTMPTYQSTSALQSKLIGYINSLIDFSGDLESLGTISEGGYSVSFDAVTTWVLDIVIPGNPTAAQQAAIAAAQDYATVNSIELYFTIIP